MTKTFVCRSLRHRRARVIDACAAKKKALFVRSVFSSELVFLCPAPKAIDHLINQEQVKMNRVTCHSNVDKLSETSWFIRAASTVYAFALQQKFRPKTRTKKRDGIYLSYFHTIAVARADGEVGGWRQRGEGRMRTVWMGLKWSRCHPNDEYLTLKTTSLNTFCEWQLNRSSFQSIAKICFT